MVRDADTLLKNKMIDIDRQGQGKMEADDYGAKGSTLNTHAAA